LTRDDSAFILTRRLRLYLIEIPLRASTSVANLSNFSSVLSILAFNLS